MNDKKYLKNNLFRLIGSTIRSINKTSNNCLFYKSILLTKGIWLDVEIYTNDVISYEIIKSDRNK